MTRFYHAINREIKNIKINFRGGGDGVGLLEQKVGWPRIIYYILWKINCCNFCNDLESVTCN